jgi:hypothetical protein
MVESLMKNKVEWSDRRLFGDTVATIYGRDWERTSIFSITIVFSGPPEDDTRDMTTGAQALLIYTLAGAFVATSYRVLR